MAKVKFYKLDSLKDWNAKYEGIYVQLTKQSSVKNGTATTATTFPAGLYFGSASGWVRLDNTDATSAASQIAALDVSGYVQAVDNLNATGENAGKITIKGIKEVDGKISNDSTKDVTIDIGAYVLSKLSTVDVLRYKGVIDASVVGGASTAAGEKGDVYKVTNPGKVNGISVEAGDMLICNADNTIAGDSTKWDIIQGNIDLAAINSEISSNYAEKNHASSENTYGLGNADLYGHVKLKSGNLNNVTYEDGVAAAASHTHSQYAASNHNHDTVYVKKNNDITASSTYHLVTYDAKGLVTGGKAIGVDDIPDLPSDKIVGMNNYSKAQSASAIQTSDTLNGAIGKLEYKVDDVIEGLDWLTTLA